MGKPILNNHIIEIHLQDEECEQAKIEWTGHNEYHVYDDNGEGVAVAMLDTHQITELTLTGSVEVSERMKIVYRGDF